MAKKNVLKKNYEFNRVYRRGKVYKGHALVLHLLRGRSGASRAGVTVSRQIRGAVQRNRVKRLLRESIRLHAGQLSDAYDFILMGRSGVDELKLGHVESEFLVLAEKAGLLKRPKTPAENVGRDEGTASGV